jgi:hypothetical protein
MTTKQVLIDLISQIQKGINKLPQDTTSKTLEDLYGKLDEVLTSIPAVQGEGENLGGGDDENLGGGENAGAGAGGRRRSAKKRGTQRKQKRRQRRGSRRAY